MGEAGERIAASCGAGALATAAQVALQRDVAVSCGGDELSCGLALGAWLGAIGLGACAARRVGRPERIIGPLFAAAAFAGPIVLAAGRLVRGFGAGAPGELPGVLGEIGFAALGLGLPGLVLGALFVALAAAQETGPRGAGIARFYVAEAAGALGGGVVSTVGFGAASPLWALWAFGLAALAAGWPAARRGGRREGSAPIVAAAALLAVGPWVGPLDGALEGRRLGGIVPGARLVWFGTTRMSALSLAEVAQTRLWVSGGVLAASFPEPEASELQAHVLASFAPRPRRVVSFGGLEAGALRFLLRHAVERVTLVEADRAAFARLAAALPPEDRAALADRRVEVVRADPRRFAAERGGAYDLALLLDPEPRTLLRARLSTREFFEDLRGRMAEDGVVVVALRTAPNAVGGDTRAFGGAVFGALRAAFPVVRATPGPEAFLVAGRTATATVDPAVLAERWRTAGIAGARFDGGLLPLMFPAEQSARHEASLRAGAAAVGASRDARPAAFQWAAARRASGTGGPLGKAAAALFRAPSWTAAVALAVPALAVAAAARFGGRRRRRRRAAVVALAAMGAAAAGWSVLAMLAFQTMAGEMFGALGLLTGCFMAGLALGGGAARRWAVGGADEAAAAIAGGATLRGCSGSRPVGGAEGEAAAVAGGVAGVRDAVRPASGGRAARRLRWVVAGAAAWGAAFPALLWAAGWAGRGGLGAGLAAFGLLLAASGAVAGAVFQAGVGALTGAGEAGARAAAAAAGADHLGASALALAAAAFFVPVLGVPGTALCLGAILVAALLA